MKCFKWLGRSRMGEPRMALTSGTLTAYDMTLSTGHGIHWTVEWQTSTIGRIEIRGPVTFPLAPTLVSLSRFQARQAGDVITGKEKPVLMECTIEAAEAIQLLQQFAQRLAGSHYSHDVEHYIAVFEGQGTGDDERLVEDPDTQ